MKHEELPEELKALILFEEMQNFNKDLEDFKKYSTFVKLRQEFEDQELLKELKDDIKQD